MQRSKLEFSKLQLGLLTASETWNARRELVEQLYKWLGDTLNELKELHQPVLLTTLPIASLTGKISRGENYNGYPYVLLDYPNHFSKDEILAARNLIWFGNGFHCTLHVRTDNSDGLIENIIAKFFEASFRMEKIYVCTADNEWIHDINKTGWCKVKDVTLDQLENIRQLGWIKLGIKLSINKPDKWQKDLVEVYKTWSELVKR